MRQVDNYQALILSIVNQETCFWAYEPGMQVVFNIDERATLMLRIEPGAQRQAQLRQSLLRRYQQPGKFEEYFLLTDQEQAFIVQRSFDEALLSEEECQHTLAQLFTLAGIRGTFAGG